MCRSPVTEQLSNSEPIRLGFLDAGVVRIRTRAYITGSGGGGKKINLSFRTFGKIRSYIGISKEGRKIAVACGMEQSPVS